MLNIRNVTKTYGGKVNAVDEVSLSLGSGVVGLIGHNGAGKTSLMQMLATLTKPTSGTIFFDGVDIVHKPDAIRHRLGFLPQHFGVYPNLSALEFLNYFAMLKGVRDPVRIQHALETVNLHDQAHRMASSFSGGMMRRLGIAQALLNDPDILIVDEPTAGLDPEERLRFRHLLSEIGFRKLVIVSTHIVSDIEDMASELVILRKGKLIAHETPTAIMAEVNGKIWNVSVEQEHYTVLRDQVQILQAIPQGRQVHLRIAHPVSPCDGAKAATPSLEDALMSQRYATQESN